ncbi:hypothetical protein ACI2S5_26165 [Ralstonia nicotianae]|nr:hypothetical protein [Ralstonia pseudosolanacearum]QKL54743.1 hypothetical protein HI816_23480 [Ralstonia solanacearum]MDO3516083.1 hypothetical protein [Ralstonia pseudosolanacearum]OAI60375.1 hypothetical protein RSP781_22505 [Ralstonia pseudosolanacearum]QKM25996.1 hypothetical protein HI796_23475 [Ralstonia solanacearum]QKM30803.1 hypothetical protein HI795_23480 [Ralstonia solanacearum]
MRTVAAAAALLLAAHAIAATDASSLQALDARIADAKQAATMARKAADTNCQNAGYAMGQRDLGLTNNANRQFTQCMDAMQAENNAIGFVGYLYEQRSHLTGQPLPREYACSGKPNLGAPHPDAKGHYTVCPKDPDNHSYKFWIITQVRMQIGSAKETWSDGGIISVRRYNSEPECRAGIAKYEDYPSKVPYTAKDGVIVGDVCVEVFIPDVRKLQQ